MRLRGAAVLAGCFLLVFHANAYSDSIKRTCEGEEGARVECETSFSDEGSRFHAICTQVWPGKGGAPAMAGVFKTYICEYDIQNGEKVVECTGGIGMVLGVKVTLGENQFLDAKARCSKLCSPCPKGWK